MVAETHRDVPVLGHGELCGLSKSNRSGNHAEDSAQTDLGLSE